MRTTEDSKITLVTGGDPPESERRVQQPREADARRETAKRPSGVAKEQNEQPQEVDAQPILRHCTNYKRLSAIADGTHSSSSVRAGTVLICTPPSDDEDQSADVWETKDDGPILKMIPKGDTYSHLVWGDKHCGG